MESFGSSVFSGTGITGGTDSISTLSVCGVVFMM